MTKVWCPCVECMYNEKQRCKAHEIKFKWRHMQTVNEGGVDMWVCEKYRLTKKTQEIAQQLENLM